MIKYSSEKQSSICKFFFSAVNLGLEAFNFTDDLQWVLFYTMSSCSCHAYLTSFYMTSHSLTTTMTNCELNCQLTSQFSTNRVDEDLF